ncbi:MAG: prepilin-type N-terminal cleavage/methylation domain-containing protein [Candidatus Lernaella stagnicola]|nr:prepilin-type N-terminal cleavage/methylation domain-containing protein [Candidatus Lernaella stagnicola]
MLTKVRDKISGSTRVQDGFSMIEMLVAVVLAAVLVLVIYSVFTAYRRTVIYQEDLVEIQQAGRHTISRLRDDLMLIGRGVKVNEGQEMIIYAAPWEFVFNGDVGDLGQLEPGDPPVQYGPGLSYLPSQDWDSAAETTRFYMRGPLDTINMPDDRDYSYSLYDGALRRSINGKLAHDQIVGFSVRHDNGTFGGYDTAPSSTQAERHVAPLFSYWGDFDFDPGTTDTLWGDFNDDGVLGDSEIEALYKGAFQFSYDGPAGSVTVRPARGAIYLITDSSNDEDRNNNNLLDANEDVNGNGRLDPNILQSVIHRVELSITTIAQNPDQEYQHPREPSYQFRENWIHTAVDPRNLRKDEERDCGGPPGPPGNVLATLDECGGAIHVFFSRSDDDGIGENDVLWYDVSRKVAGSAPGSPVAQWRPMAVVPALGRANYAVDDFDPTVGQSHSYRVRAVDCGDSRSPYSSPSAGVTPLVGAPDAPSNVRAFDTPCYTDTMFGSITVTWEAALNEADITEYWVFRGDAEDLSDYGTYPVAKLITSPTDPNGPNTNCTSSTEVFQGHVDCRNSNYYKVSTTYVWRDQINSPGRTSGSGTPFPGSMWDIGIPRNRYHYVVRAYDGNPNSSNYECLSNPAHLISDCGRHDEVQSFDNSLSGGGGGGSRTLFSPPHYLDVIDQSSIGWNGQIENARMRVKWYASLDQWCTAGETPDYYLIYRNRLWGLDFLNLIGDEYEVNFDDGDVIVFPAVQITNSTQQEYVWYDDNNLYKQNPAPDSHTPYLLNYAMADLRPATGSSVDNSGRLYDGLLSGGTDPQYDYVVVAANTPGTWGFGATCPFLAGYQCFSECSGVVEDGTNYAEQHSMRGDEEATSPGEDDTIRVSWNFHDAPPADARVDLHARIFPGGDWFEVENDVAHGSWNTSTTYVGNHEYVLQDHGELYEYSIVITCPENDPLNPSPADQCQRRVLLGASIGANVPGVPDWCVTPAMPPSPNPCPADAGRYCDGTARVVFYMTDRLVSPHGDRSQTADDYLFFRVARWRKLPADEAFPVDPEAEYLLRTPNIANPGNVLAPNGMLCPNLQPYCYDHPSQYYPGAPPPYHPRFDVFTGSFTYNRTTSPATNLRRFRFEETLEPNYIYKYTLETRITHTGSPPRDCCRAEAPGSQGCDTTCNGSPADAIFVEFATDQPCYPYEYHGAGGGSYCCAPVTSYEKDPFTGMANIIGYRDATPSVTGWREPWDNRMWPMDAKSIYIAIDTFLGTIVIFDWEFMALGQAHFRYHNNTIRTDFNDFFGNWLWPFDTAITINIPLFGTFTIPILYSGTLKTSMCGSCIGVDLPLIGTVNLLCATDFWSTCFRDVEDLFSYAYLWDNFAQGNCSATANGAIEGDFLMQWHSRSVVGDRQLGLAFRGYYDPNNIVNTQTWLMTADYSAANGVNYEIGYQRYDSTNNQAMCEKEKRTFHGVAAPAYDTYWWSNLALVCNRAQPNPAAGYGQMFVFWWSEPDPGKTLDLQQVMYSTVPKLAYHTIGATFNGAPYYNPNGSHIAQNTGLVGFWTDPYVDWTSDNYYLDNVRIIPYCGECPPNSLSGYVGPANIGNGPQACHAEYVRANAKAGEVRKGVAAKGPNALKLPPKTRRTHIPRWSGQQPEKKGKRELIYREQTPRNIKDIDTSGDDD